jgi:peptidoglycan/LPS O-acetylase OafA/YrhL
MDRSHSSQAEPPASARASYDYMPALDGCRAISIALVVVSHSGLEHVVPGLLGVLIFFVISGFLITRQMIAEIERTGRLGIRAFYLRRVFRLAPALLAYIAMFTVVLGALGAVISPTQILSGVFYFANYYTIFVGFPPHNPIPITWSLSVEEHFYIVFPFLMIAFRRNPGRILPLLVSLVVAVLCWRLYLFTHCDSGGAWLAGQLGCGRTRDFRTHGTDVIFDTILYGSIAALLLHYHEAACRRWLLRRAVVIGAGLALLATLAYRDVLFRDTVRFSIQSIAIAALIVNLLFNPALETPRRLLSLPPMLLVGRLSYSLYLFHFGVLNTLYSLLGTEHSLSNPVAVILYYILSGLMAVASYHLIEQPMVKLRKRFGSHNAEDRSVRPEDVLPGAVDALEDGSS